jgi:hypothetical protein
MSRAWQVHPYLRRPKPRSGAGATQRMLRDPKMEPDAHLVTKKNNSTNFGEKPFFSTLNPKKG